MKKSTKISMLSIAAVLVVVIALSCVLVACNKPNTGNNNTNTTTDVATNFVNIDINPSVELVLDQNNCVMKANAENADAQILLQNADGIVGANVNVAVQNIGKLAIEMNYVQENSSINISVTGDSEVDVAAIKEEVRNGLVSATAGLSIQVEEGLDMALQFELDAIKQAYADNTKIQALDIAKYRLVRSAMLAKPGLTFTEAVELSNAELAQIVEETKTVVKAQVNDTKATLFRNAARAYENAKDVALDFAYPMFTLLNETNRNNSIQYVALHIQELCMKHAYDEIKMEILDKEYTAAEIDVIAAKLYDTKEEQNAFKDGAKDITSNKLTWTKGSVMHYMDMQYRRTANDQREAFRAKYAEAAAIMEEEVAKPHEFNVSAELDDFKGSISLVVPGYNGEALKNINKEIDTLLSQNINENPKAYEERIDAVVVKVAEAKETMLKGITNEDTLNNINNWQNAYTKTMTALEKAYDNAVDALNASANRWISDIQAERRAMKQAA